MSKSILSAIRLIISSIGVVIITLPGSHLIAQETGFNGICQSCWFSIIDHEDSASSKIFIPETTNSSQFASFSSNSNLQINQAAIEAEKLIEYYFKMEDFESSILEHFKGIDKQKDVHWIKKVETAKQKILNEKFKINIKQVSSATLNYRFSKLTYTSDKHAINILLNAEWLNYGMKTEAITKAILEETGKVIEDILYKDISPKQHPGNEFAEYLMGVYFGS